MQAVAVKQKYAEALELLRALPGTDTSLDEQETAIEDAKKELKRIRCVSLFVSYPFNHLRLDECDVSLTKGLCHWRSRVLCECSDQVELYSHTLYRGTDEPRAEINDAFSRKSL